jgi:hypothetical protein
VKQLITAPHPRVFRSRGGSQSIGVQVVSRVRALPQVDSSISDQVPLPVMLTRLALAGLGAAAVGLVLSLVMGTGPAIAQAPEGPPSAPAGSATGDLLLVDPVAEIVIPQATEVPLAEPPRFAAFRATTSMTSAQQAVCPIVDINSWRVPSEDPGQVPAAGTGTMSGADKPMTGAAQNSDALSSSGVLHRAFTLGERASAEELPSSPTYELASTPG